jgi:hypothetical protein
LGIERAARARPDLRHDPIEVDITNRDFNEAADLADLVALAVDKAQARKAV